MFLFCSKLNVREEATMFLFMVCEGVKKKPKAILQHFGKCICLLSC